MKVTLDLTDAQAELLGKLLDEGLDRAWGRFAYAQAAEVWRLVQAAVYDAKVPTRTVPEDVQAAMADLRKSIARLRRIETAAGAVVGHYEALHGTKVSANYRYLMARLQVLQDVLYPPEGSAG